MKQALLRQENSMDIGLKLLTRKNSVVQGYAHSMALLALFLFILSTVLLIPRNGNAAARLKDVATVKGVRENFIIGYGIVVGLKGTGDSSSDITSQSLSRLFTKLGLEVQNGANVKSKNAAAVIVTANL